MFSGLLNIKELCLSNNMIKTIPDNMFEDIGTLQKLFLAGNYLNFLKRTMFSGLHNLTELRLERNQIAAVFNATFIDMISLHILYIHGNNLSTLSPSVFAKQTKPLILALSQPDDPCRVDWKCKSLCWLRTQAQNETTNWCREKMNHYKTVCNTGTPLWENMECFERGNTSAQNSFSKVVLLNYLMMILSQHRLLFTISLSNCL